MIELNGLDYGELELEVTALLDAHFTDAAISVYVCPIPQNQADDTALNNDKRAAVIVQYITTDPGESVSINGPAHVETVTVRLIFRVFNKRDADGYYKLLKHCKYVLIGYTPNKCSQPFSLGKYDLLKFQDGVEFDSVSFETEAPVPTANYSETAIGGNLVSMGNISMFGN